MPSLVPYGSSDDEDDAEGTTPSHAAGHTCKAHSPKPAAGEARLRTVYTSLGVTRPNPVKGDWLGHIYIAATRDDQFIATLKDACHFLGAEPPHRRDGYSVTWIDHLHISLARPIALRKHEQDDLYSVVQDGIARFQGRTDTGRRRTGFAISFAGFVALPSEDAPQHTVYLAVEVAMGWRELHALSTSLNEPLQARLQQRPYFEEARFHVSFACVQGDFGDEVSTAMASTVVRLNEQFGERLRKCPPINVMDVGVTFGNRSRSFAL